MKLLRAASLWNRSVSFTVKALIIGCIFGGYWPAELTASEKRPNIVFVFTDDHAAHAISAYGSKINRTPNIDRLAKEGILFENCFCTNSICAPSRAVVLTGKHSHINGQIDNRVTFDGSQDTFPKLLQKSGYQTALIGKWHLKSNPTGFDYWATLPGQGTYYNPTFITEKGRIKHEGYTTDIITDMAIDWLDNQRSKDQPFLLLYWHKAPHREWTPNIPHFERYNDITIPEPPTLFDDYQNRTSAAKKQEMTLARHFYPLDDKRSPPQYLNAEQLAAWQAAYGPENERVQQLNLSGKDLVRWRYQRYIKDYIRCVDSVDDNLGRMLQHLEDQGLADNTIVVYSSDQGFFLGDHGWYDKRWMYEESLRMPFLVRWPAKIKPGTTSKALVQNLDFAPTFLDAAGVEAPEAIQGRSLLPILQGQQPEDWRKSIYYHYFEFPAVHAVARHYGVRTDRYKLIHYYQIDEWELFDLETDPDELMSLYDKPEQAEIQTQLKQELTRLRDHYQVTHFPEPVYPGQKQN